MVEDRVELIRATVADALEARGHGNRTFLCEIREGKRDDGPFMMGALAWEKRLAEAGQSAPLADGSL